MPRESHFTLCLEDLDPSVLAVLHYPEHVRMGPSLGGRTTSTRCTSMLCAKPLLPATPLLPMALPFTSVQCPLLLCHSTSLQCHTPYLLCHAPHTPDSRGYTCTAKHSMCFTLTTSLNRSASFGRRKEAGWKSEDNDPASSTLLVKTPFPGKWLICDARHIITNSTCTTRSDHTGR